MASMSPYTYILCPCSDPANLSRHNHNDPTTPLQPALPEDYETAFDPRAPRANFSLYPLEYLLYCVECHQIRCPRCIAEEIVTYYCPNCLFEVPGSNIKSDGNRCTRSCFQCPLCVGPLSVSAIDAPPPADLRPDTPSSALPSYILTCSYCQWTSTEIGIRFDKPNGIYAQLQKLRNGGKTRLTPRERKDRRKDASNTSTTTSTTSSAMGPGSGLASSALPPIGEEPAAREPAPEPEDLDVETQFANLKAFYQAQLADASSASGGLSSSLGDLGIGSPGSLSRIMSIYTGAGTTLDAAKKTKAARAGQAGAGGLLREALDPDEGLLPAALDERSALARLHHTPAGGGAGGDTTSRDWRGTASRAQLAAQPPVNVGEPPGAPLRFLDDLRPVACLLRTKRSKRCPVCRHIVSKPEAKVSNTRFRIRLVAGNYIPTIASKPLQATSLSQTISGAPGASGRDKHASSSSSSTILGGGGVGAPAAASKALAPLRPVQYLLTFKNPIFEPVKVTLATPSVTPGRFASKVTVLCPQFEIDANTDVWDDVLKDGGKGGGGGGGHAASLHEAAAGAGQHLQAEPGKVWERGRNWVTIVVEVVPASLRLDKFNGTITARDATGGLDLSPLREDEDVLEIPMYVRLEWEAEDAGGEGGASRAKDKGEGREKRELAYWCALGIGRISQD